MEIRAVLALRREGRMLRRAVKTIVLSMSGLPMGRGRLGRRFCRLLRIIWCLS